MHQRILTPLSPECGFIEHISVGISLCKMPKCGFTFQLEYHPPARIVPKCHRIIKRRLLVIVLNVFRSCYLNRWFCKFRYISVSTIDLLGPGQHSLTYYVTIHKSPMLACLYIIQYTSSYIANRWLKHYANDRHIITKPTKNSTQSGRCLQVCALRLHIRRSDSRKIPHHSHVCTVEGSSSLKLYNDV